jgi:hypothetical protein
MAPHQGVSSVLEDKLVELELQVRAAESIYLTFVETFF